jgi:hypothetical protein
VSFSADASGDDTISAIPDDQTVIDAIEANSGAGTPLSDTFYYQLTNAVGTTVEQVTYDLNDVEFNTSGSPYASPSTVAPDTSTNISGLTVDTALATGQSTDANEVLSVTVSLFDFTTQQSDGNISIDPSQTGSGANTGETITTDNTDQTHSVTIDGTIAQIDADLQGLTYTSAASGDDSILVQAVDGPATTADFIIGEVQTNTAAPPPQMLPSIIRSTTLSTSIPVCTRQAAIWTGSTPEIRSPASARTTSTLHRSPAQIRASRARPKSMANICFYRQTRMARDKKVHWTIRPRSMRSRRIVLELPP